MANQKKLDSSERYQRQKLRKEGMGRHDRIVSELGMPSVRRFEAALEDYRPQCVLEPLADGSWPKSPWTDWSSDPEQGEPYERPSTNAARLMCEDCPLIEMCLDYALATGQSHSVWGGRVIENGQL